MDTKATIALFAFVGIVMFLLGLGIGIGIGDSDVRAEAVKVGAACYESDQNGQPKFVWKPQQDAH